MSPGGLGVLSPLRDADWGALDGGSLSASEWNGGQKRERGMRLFFARRAPRRAPPFPRPDATPDRARSDRSVVEAGEGGEGGEGGRKQEGRGGGD